MHVTHFTTTTTTTTTTTNHEAAGRWLTCWNVRLILTLFFGGWSEELPRYSFCMYFL